MPWSAGSRWVGVGAGSGAAASAAGNMVWAPGAGINSGQQWEEFSDLYAAAPTTGLVSVLVDTTSSAGIATYDLASNGLNLQRFRFYGYGGNAMVRPEIRIPSGVSVESPIESTACVIKSTGGHYVLSGSSVCSMNICQLTASAAGNYVLRATAGINYMQWLAVVASDSGGGNACVRVDNGVYLGGRLISCNIDNDQLDDAGGTGTIAFDQDASTAVGSQALWASRPRPAGKAEAILYDSPGAPLSAGSTLDPLYSFVFVNAAGGAGTINLPPIVSGMEGRKFILKNNSSSVNAMVLDADGTDLIDGAATYACPLVGFWSLTLIPAGGTWWVV